jgi:Ulp1 family protease
MLRARTWIGSTLIDLCATYFAQRSTNPVVLARSDHYDNLLQPGADIHQHPTLNLTYFGIPDSTITLNHEIVVPFHLPSHWTLVIIQPTLQRLIYYDGLGGDPASVVPVISDWLGRLYASKGLTPTTPVNSWPTICPTDAPKQGDSYNCGPDSLLFLYMWLIHR